MVPRAEALILVHQGLHMNTANGHSLHMQYKNTTIDARVDKVYTHLRPPHGQRHALIRQLPEKAAARLGRRPWRGPDVGGWGWGGGGEEPP